LALFLDAIVTSASNETKSWALYWRRSRAIPLVEKLPAMCTAPSMIVTVGPVASSVSQPLINLRRSKRSDHTTLLSWSWTRAICAVA
jgi:hypothetical protein